MSANGPFQSGPRNLGPEMPSQDRPQAMTPSLAERLDYLADLILELKAIAETARLNKLAVILAAAWEEARVQRDAVRER